MWPLWLCSLPAGSDYRAGDLLEPDQHIYRARNRDWPELPQLLPTISKFSVKSYTYLLRDPDRLSYGYWSPYDLLGFSSRGWAQPLPLQLTDVLPPYDSCVFSVVLADCGKYQGGVGDIPFMFQCTWREEGKATPFSLGASLAGYSWEVDETGSWRTDLRWARYDLLREHLVGANFEFDNLPERNKLREGGLRRGTRFGNCTDLPVPGVI